jgi:hypothetical protein
LKELRGGEASAPRSVKMKSPVSTANTDVARGDRLRHFKRGRRVLRLITALIVLVLLAIWSLRHFLGLSPDIPQILALFVITMLAASLLAAIWIMKCPFCQKRFHVITFEGDREALSIFQRIPFCPYCGVKLDEDRAFTPTFQRKTKTEKDN